MELIELNVPVGRDDNGWWSNPAIPDFDEDHAAYSTWQKDQGIELVWTMLEDEDESHPAYVEYYTNENIDVSAWSPTPPCDGWHTFSIHDTESGPCWVWARRGAVALGGAQ